jgi:hypothetical protein
MEERECVSTGSICPLRPSVSSGLSGLPTPNPLHELRFKEVGDPGWRFGEDGSVAGKTGGGVACSGIDSKGAESSTTSSGTSSLVTIGADAGIVGLCKNEGGRDRGLLIGDAIPERDGDMYPGLDSGEEADGRREGPASLPSRDVLGEGDRGFDLEGSRSRKPGLRGGDNGDSLGIVSCPIWA